jgi:putative SOS response-associated peptidase YedK
MAGLACLKHNKSNCRDQRGGIGDVMCNDYRLEVDVASIAEDFEELKIKIQFSEGIPNVAPRADIKITDIAPIVRTAAEGRAIGDLVQRRWSWPGRTRSRSIISDPKVGNSPAAAA